MEVYLYKWVWQLIIQSNSSVLVAQCILLVIKFLESEILELAEYFLDVEILLDLHPLQSQLFTFA